MPETTFEDWVTTIEACSILNRSEGWLRLNHKKYGIDRKRVGQTMMYNREQIDKLSKTLRGDELRAAIAGVEDGDK